MTEKLFAQMLAERDATITRLENELAAARETESIQSRTILADEALLETLIAGGGLTELEGGMQRALGLPVRLLDLTVKYQADSNNTEITATERALITQSAKQDAVVAGVGEDGQPLTVMTARRGSEAVGALLLQTELSEVEPVVLRRCARTLATFLTAQRRVRGDLELRRRELLEQVIDPPAGGISQATLRRLAEHGVLQDSPFRILVARGSGNVLEEFDHRLEFDFGAQLLRATIDDEMIALFNEKSFQALREMLTNVEAKVWARLQIGHSPKLHRLEIVPPELSLVRRVVAASAQAGGRAGQLVSLESYGALGAFLSSINLEPTRMAVQEYLKPLLEYDARHGTELCETAYNYFDLGRSVAMVAREMHVHENTVRQRLDRITLLLGEDWAYGQAGLDYHIMLAARRLLEA